MAVDTCTMRRDDTRKTSHERWIHPEGFFNDSSQIRQCSGAAECYVLGRSECRSNLTDEEAHSAWIRAQVVNTAREKCCAGLTACNDQTRIDRQVTQKGIVRG